MSLINRSNCCRTAGSRPRPLTEACLADGDAAPARGGYYLVDTGAAQAVPSHRSLPNEG